MYLLQDGNLDPKWHIHFRTYITRIQSVGYQINKVCYCNETWYRWRRLIGCNVSDSYYLDICLSPGDLCNQEPIKNGHSKIKGGTRSTSGQPADHGNYLLSLPVTECENIQLNHFYLVIRRLSFYSNLVQSSHKERTNVKAHRFPE